MPRSKSKSAALTVASGLMAWSAALVSTGEYATGGLAGVVALGLFFGYQYIEEDDHRQMLDDVVASLGEERVREIVEGGGDALDGVEDPFERNGGSR